MDAIMANKEQNVSTVFLGVLTLVALGTVLVLMKSVLLPLVLAVFLSYIFKPIVLYLRGKRVPNMIALLVVFLFISGLFFGLGSIIYSSVGTFVREVPRYQDRLAVLLTNSSTWLQHTAEQLGFDVSGMSPADVIDVGSVGAFVTSSAGSFLTLLSDFFVVILLMFFILAGSGTLAGKVEQALAERHSQAVAAMIRTIDVKVRQYLIAKTLISLGTGALTTVTLLILGVDFALLWGFLTFLLNFIPNIGSIVAVFFPLLFSLLQFDTLTTPLLVLVILVVMQNLMGNVIEPKLMAFSLDLSPLLVLIALLLWGWLWGIWGMILSVPIMSTIKIVCENIDGLKPIAVLMSGGKTR